MKRADRLAKRMAIRDIKEELKKEQRCFINFSVNITIPENYASNIKH